jgi:hypothetical protein
MIGTGAMTGMRGIGTGAAIVTIDMTTGKIGAMVATVTGVIADAMSEKKSGTTINIPKQGAIPRRPGFVRRDSETRLCYMSGGNRAQPCPLFAFAVLI